MGSTQNVEIYRCIGCGDDVAVVPAGFTLTSEEEQEKAEDHLRVCPANQERTATTVPKTQLAEAWRDWTEDERTKQPKRFCSVAGCTAAPTRVKETRTLSGAIRRHAYCEQHAVV